jgi:hypothetical protein
MKSMCLNESNNNVVRGDMELEILNSVKHKQQTFAKVKKNVHVTTHSLFCWFFRFEISLSERPAYKPRAVITQV